MKSLKIISLYKIIIISLFITLGITYYRIKNDSLEYKEYKTITGIINDIKEKETGIQIELLSKEKILVKYNEKINYKLGDQIKVKGIVEIPSENTIPNLFNYKKYLKTKKINYIYKAEKIELINKNKSLKYKIKNKLIEHINKYKSKDYLETFLLGKNNIEEEIKVTYQTNGISHLFAISGMHLSLFASIFLFILKKLNIKENINYIIIIIFFIFFAFITNYTPSVLRALILYILLSINKIFKLNLKAIYLITIDFIILIIYNPFFIYNTGFLYSFAASASLIKFSEIINKYNNYFIKILITSIISFVVSIPITINNFHEINILTPIINIIFVPLVSIIIFPMSLILLLLKPLDNLFFIITSIMEQLSLIISNVRINLVLAHIPLYMILIYYTLIIIFIKGLENKKIIKLIPLIIILIIHTNIRYIVKTNKVTFLDVNQGDSIILKLSKNNIMIDTGGNKNSSIIVNKTIPYLKSLGITKLDLLIITHGDYDHMGEAINLVNNFKVEKVIFNCGEFNDLENELIKVLNKKKIPYYSCIKELNIDNNKLYFLQTKEYDNENDNSNVIYTELNGHKFMFMGDASVSTEHEILNKYNLHDIDVLKVGHHGSKTSSSKEFIDEINPKYSIISVGKNNRYGHPNKEVLDVLSNSKIYRTDEDGSIMFKIKNNKLRIETYSP